MLLIQKVSHKKRLIYFQIAYDISLYFLENLKIIKYFKLKVIYTLFED